MWFASGSAITLAGGLREQDMLLARLQDILKYILPRNMIKEDMIDVKHGLSFPWDEERISP